MNMTRSFSFNFTQDMYPPAHAVLGSFLPDVPVLSKTTPLSYEPPSDYKMKRNAVAGSIFCINTISASSCLSRFTGQLPINAKIAAENDFDVLLFVSQELKESVRNLCPSCVLYVMPECHHHGIGSLWRFQAANFRQFSVVGIPDTDEPWDWIYKWVHMLRQEKLSDWSWARMLPSRSSSFKIATHAPVTALNYAPMIASHVIAQPRNVDVEILNSIARYASLRKHKSRSDTPWHTGPGEHNTLFNMPIGEHKFGWGNIPHIYGFDESFLKRVVFSHAVMSGKLVTFDYDINPQHQGGDPTDNPGENAYVEADLAFVTSVSGNRVLNV